MLDPIRVAKPKPAYSLVIRVLRHGRDKFERPWMTAQNLYPAIVKVMMVSVLSWRLGIKYNMRVFQV